MIHRQQGISATVVALLLCLWQPLFAQRQQAKKDICHLTSSRMSGRGYINEGHLKAARYIQKQFRSCGLLPVTDDGFQHFTISVNTFPGKMELVMDGKALAPGIDFLVHPSSAGGHADLPLAMADSADLIARMSRNSDTCFVIQRKTFDVLRQSLSSVLYKNTSGALLVLEPSKLTWSVGARPFSIPIFEVKEKSFDEKSKRISFQIDEQFLPELKTQNVIGMIRGKVQPDSFIVFTAHYDHLGMMGTKTMFPGANDNASGTAMLLALARHYSNSANRPHNSMLFIAFSAEEAGLLGSEYYTEHPLFPLGTIRFLINLDLAGNGSEGITVVNATEFPGQYSLLDSINTANKFLPSVYQRGKARNSDHYYFSEKGVPAFFIYTMGGKPWYHDVMDRCSELTLSHFDAYFRLLTAFADEL